MPNSFTDVIDLWPAVPDLAADISVKVGTVHKWRTRNGIPQGHWQAVLDAAEKREIQLDADTLVRIAS